MCVTYTARYVGNGPDRVDFESTGAPGDNTDVNGTITLEPIDAGSTRGYLANVAARLGGVKA